MSMIDLDLFILLFLLDTMVKKTIKIHHLGEYGNALYYFEPHEAKSENHFDKKFCSR